MKRKYKDAQQFNPKVVAKVYNWKQPRLFLDKLTKE